MQCLCGLFAKEDASREILDRIYRIDRIKKGAVKG